MHKVYFKNAKFEEIEARIAKEYAKFDSINEMSEFEFKREVKKAYRGAKQYNYRANVVTDGGNRWIAYAQVYVYPNGTPSVTRCELKPNFEKR